MTARSVLIHAGQHKTGSTTIQRALETSGPMLRDHGITVWDVTPNHTVPLHLALVERCVVGKS